MYSGKKLSVKMRSLAGRLLRGGGSPGELSAAICLAAAVGVIPFPWGATPLCALLAARFGLNQMLVQAVNYCCYPLQLALFLPFCRLGDFLFPWGPEAADLLTGAPGAGIGASLNNATWVVIRGLGGLGGWLVTAPPLACMLFPLLKALLSCGALSRSLSRFSMPE